MTLHLSVNKSTSLLLVGVVMVITACGDTHSSPKSVVEEFIQVGAEGKFDALKPLCAKVAPEELCNPDVDDREEFVKVIKTAKIIGEPKIEDSKALVKVAISIEGETSEVNFPVVKQGDTWLLSGEPEKVES